MEIKFGFIEDMKRCLLIKEVYLIKLLIGVNILPENLADAKWYARRQNTLKGKVTYLDLIKEQFEKAKKLSKSRGTRLGGEVIVDDDLLKKQKTDILRTIAARAGNLSNVALKGLSIAASLPAQVIVMTLAPTEANADEVNMQLEDFAKLAEEAQPKKEKMATGGKAYSTDIKDYWRRAWGLGDRVGFSRAGMVAASNPLLRGTTGPSQVLKAPRGYTGMQAILALENLPEPSFLKKDEDESKKDIVERIEKVEKDRKEPDQEPPKDPNDQTS